MGNTLWILEEYQSTDNWDHSEILNKSKDLDALCTQLNLSKISNYFDESILAEEFGMEIEPKYFSADIIEMLSKLIEKVDLSNTELIDELKDMLKKAILAKEKNVQIRLASVP